MKLSYPENAEAARKQVVAWLNRILEVDKDFALKLMNTRFSVSDAIMDAEGVNEVQLVVGKDDDLGWNCSFLGLLNGALEALGCERVGAVVDVTAYNPPQYPVVNISAFKPYDWPPKADDEA